ncbi:MAG: outer membrane protein transport protein [Bacteroidales bacterium]
MIKKNLGNLATLAKKSLMVAAIASSAIIGTAINANAEGYQINSQSARQLGMGHTGVALKLGAESMLFNPASMAFMENKFDISLGLTGVKTYAKYTNGAYCAKTDNPVGTPLFGYIGYKPMKNLAFGISITNPVGNSLKWPDNWQGSSLVEEISLKGFSIQPTVSYKFGNFVSIGAGLMIDYGNFSLSRALIPVGGFDAIGQMIPALKPAIKSFEGQIPLSAKLGGDAKVGFGYNIGVLVNVSKKISIGASYRSKIDFTVGKGTAELNYASDAVKNIIKTVNSVKPGTIVVPPIDEGTFEATLPAPSNFNVGIAYKPIKDLTLTAELQFVGWKAYDTLTIQFEEKVLNGYSLQAEKNYKSTIIYRIGGEYNISKLATVRLGAYYDTTPVRTELYNPETPGSNKFCITAGASIRPLKFMSIDIAFGYMNGEKTHGTYPINETSLFEGDYKSYAFMPSLGVSFKF